LWGKEEAQKLIQESNLKFDVIIGADIIFWPQSVPGLVETLDIFRKHNPNIKIFITGAKRTKQSEDDIDKNLLAFGLSRTIIKVFEDYKLPVYLYEV
jgi:predicted nicotinamide N-methyase